MAGNKKSKKVPKRKPETPDHLVNHVLNDLIGEEAREWIYEGGAFTDAHTAAAEEARYFTIRHFVEALRHRPVDQLVTEDGTEGFEKLADAALSAVESVFFAATGVELDADESCDLSKALVNFFDKVLSEHVHARLSR